MGQAMCGHGTGAVPAQTMTAVRETRCLESTIRGSMVPGGGGLIDSRRFPRVEAAFPVRVQEAPGPPSEGKATDLSPSGVKIRGASVAPPAIVQLEFSLAPTDPAFSVLAVALRSDLDGTAFAFVNLTKPDFLRLRRQVETLFLRRQLYLMVIENNPDAPQTLAQQGLRLPVVAISAASEAEAISSLKAGVLHFLRKPLDMEQFRLTLDMLELTGTKARLDTIERAFQLAF